jgi:hypothetical protein
VNIGLNPFEQKIPRYAEKYGFDFKQTVVHGTSKENARKIVESGELIDGTYVHSGLGGFIDASVWASNSYTNPVVIMAEVEEPLNRPHSTSWITIGKRGKEREGHDVIMDKLTIKKIMVFDVPKSASQNSTGILKEDKSLRREFK